MPALDTRPTAGIILLLALQAESGGSADCARGRASPAEGRVQVEPVNAAEAVAGGIAELAPLRARSTRVGAGAGRQVESGRTFEASRDGSAG